MTKLLFIDRDGTIIREPDDEQVDSLDKLSFVPGAITALHNIAQLDYGLVLVSNQDGLGTPAFPTADFEPPHRKMLETLEGEGVSFIAEHIDPTFPADNAPTRKPGTAMLTRYLDGSFDIARSYVIGDRETDRQLAANLGCKAMLTSEMTWADIYARLRMEDRTASVRRTTAETDVSVSVDLDGQGSTRISTGLHFFDHMLEQIPHHSGLSLAVEAKGDIHVDDHHTVEDVGITLGQTLRQALMSKRGIDRYGFVLPMDECRAEVLIDLGGRTDFEWDVKFTREMTGDVATEMWPHFFKSLASALECNLHISARGLNNHHLIEAVFKAFARALRQAVRRDPFRYELPSSKAAL